MVGEPSLGDPCRQQNQLQEVPAMSAPLINEAIDRLLIRELIDSYGTLYDDGRLDEFANLFAYCVGLNILCAPYDELRGVHNIR